MCAEVGITVNGKHAVLAIGKRNVRVLRHDGGGDSVAIGVVVAPDGGHWNIGGGKLGDGERRAVVAQADHVTHTARNHVVQRALRIVVVVVDVGEESDFHRMIVKVYRWYSVCGRRSSARA